MSAKAMAFFVTFLGVANSEATSLLEDSSLP